MRDFGAGMEVKGFVGTESDVYRLNNSVRSKLKSASAKLVFPFSNQKARKLEKKKAN